MQQMEVGPNHLLHLLIDIQGSQMASVIIINSVLGLL